MAEAFARKNGIVAESAGTLPSSQVNPTVAQAMEEKGIDLSKSIPKLLTLEMIESADLVVTMGCSIEKVCPAPIIKRMAKNFIEWHLDDPKGQPLTEVRRIRDEIESKVSDLAERLTQNADLASPGLGK